MLLVVLATLCLSRLSLAAPSPSPAPEDFPNSTEEQHLTALESQLSSLNDSLVVGNVSAVTQLLASFVAANGSNADVVDAFFDSAYHPGFWARHTSRSCSGPRMWSRRSHYNRHLTGQALDTLAPVAVAVNDALGATPQNIVQSSGNVTAAVADQLPVKPADQGVGAAEEVAITIV
ncbi:hypothetical protein WJX82_005495 [Trebouxia sp. C0006]